MRSDPQSNRHSNCANRCGTRSLKHPQFRISRYLDRQLFFAFLSNSQNSQLPNAKAKLHSMFRNSAIRCLGFAEFTRKSRHLLTTWRSSVQSISTRIDAPFLIRKYPYMDQRTPLGTIPESNPVQHGSVTERNSQSTNVSTWISDSRSMSPLSSILWKLLPA